MHRFADSLQRGDEGERFLDSLFGRWHVITPATREEQRHGIDRHFRSRTKARHWTVEYKTDFAATRTGNAFVETVSVDNAGKAGWALKSGADVILYYLPLDDLIYVLRPPVLRRQLERWTREYPTRAAMNDGYRTLGICVPLHEFEQHAYQAINLADFPEFREAQHA